MSGFGISNLPALSLPSSVAGGQQAKPGQDTVRADAAKQDFRSTLEALSTKTSGDVADPDLNADRDADGRSLLGYSEESEPRAERKDTPRDQNVNTSGMLRTADPEGLRGRLLDLDA